MDSNPHKAVAEVLLLPRGATDVPRHTPCENGALSIAIRLCDHFADRLHEINAAIVTNTERQALIDETVAELEAAISQLAPRAT